jgi:hypothetical protein
MYDKYGCVLRIETTINDVSFFKHHRQVEHRQRPPTRVLAPVKKTIYSLIDLRKIMLGCNRRYLADLAALDDFSAGVRALDRLPKPRTVEQKTLKGINFFDPVDHALLHALQNPRVNIAGIRRADLLPLLDQLSPDRLSRQLRRLRDLGVIKRVAGTYRYYPHPHWPCRYCSALPCYSDRDHPGARINEKSVQEVSRVRSLETNRLYQPGDGGGGGRSRSVRYGPSSRVRRTASS